MLTSVSFARDGRTSAAIHESFVEAPEVWAGEVGGVASGHAAQRRRASAVGRGEEPALGERRAAACRDGSSRRPRVDPARAPSDGRVRARRPVVGVGAALAHALDGAAPHARAITSSSPTRAAATARARPSPQANVKDFGYGDLRDILKGVDAAVAAAPIDAERVGIIGWSYGGFMSMWAVTQTTRFKAAVAGAGIANWQSYYGQNRIDRWMIPFFGASVYDDPAVYARSSPITFIKNVKTPTLVLHGDRDSEVPTPQGYEFWHALKTLGVPDAARGLRGRGPRHLEAGARPRHPGADGGLVRPLSRPLRARADQARADNASRRRGSTASISSSETAPTLRRNQPSSSTEPKAWKGTTARPGAVEQVLAHVFVRPQLAAGRACGGRTGGCARPGRSRPSGGVLSTGEARPRAAPAGRGAGARGAPGRRG